MLAVARANLDRTSLRNCQVRHGDMYHLALPDGAFDAATLHNVLRFADDPAAALAEAARVLRPGGRLVVVDFAPHRLELLRQEHAHRRLGFADAEIREWFAAAGLEFEPPIRLEGDPLTVVIWPARRIGAVAAFDQPDQPRTLGRDVA
jgi:ArsR family transcriptional regulator